MDRNDIPDSALARIALDSIPTPKDDAKDIAVSYTHLDVYKRQLHSRKG